VITAPNCKVDASVYISKGFEKHGYAITTFLLMVDFHIIKCYLMNRIPAARFLTLLSLPGGFRFSAFPWKDSGASISHASLTSHVTVILYHAGGFVALSHCVAGLTRVSLVPASVGV